MCIETEDEVNTFCLRQQHVKSVLYYVLYWFVNEYKGLINRQRIDVTVVLRQGPVRSGLKLLCQGFINEYEGLMYKQSMDFNVKTMFYTIRNAYWTVC